MSKDTNVDFHDSVPERRTLADPRGCTRRTTDCNGVEKLHEAV